MNIIILTFLGRLAPLAWAAAFATCFLAPWVVPVVLGAFGTAGMIGAAIRANDRRREELIRALAEAARPQADRLRPQVRPMTRAT